MNIYRGKDYKMIKIYLGETGLNNSYQRPFPKETECVHCKKIARIAFVVCEQFDKSKSIEQQEFICNLHKNIHRKNIEKLFLGNSSWLHDAGTFAIYMCKECLEATTLWNQA